MTYRIDKDENGEEALIMTAIVRNNTVDLDWVHPDDDVEGFAQRCLVRSRALMGPNHSLPSQNAVFTLRLYRRGDVAVSGMFCEDGFRDQAIRLATEAAIDLYDEVYPDAALAAEAFIEESIATVRQFAAIHARPLLEAEMGKLLAPDELLQVSSPRRKPNWGGLAKLCNALAGMSKTRWLQLRSAQRPTKNTATFERFRRWREELMPMPSSIFRTLIN
jgi:hypothetical protein